LRVIDSHVHTWTRGILSKTDIEARTIAAQKAGTEPVLDSPADRLLKAMEEAGVERAVILPIDSGLNQEMPLGLREKTDWHVSEIQGKPSLTTFVGIDPRRGIEGLTELQRAVADKGCRGLKLYPPNGFYPDDDKFYPFYELAEELSIPVVIHQGFTSRFKHVKYARPIYVDKMATDFPGLKIVLAHVGTPWQDEALMVAAKNPNVYVDLSGWQVYARVPSKIYQLIADAALVRVFPNKMLWGSDFPLFEHMLTMTKWVQFFRKLTLPTQMIEMGYVQVKQGDIERIMWKNAAALFFGEATS
jgi:predicted TIM-barrel fold metal-dependent hydrolase